MWSSNWWMLLCSASALNFTSVWQTTVVNESITLPISSSNFNISVDWGDGPLVYTSLPVTYFYVYSGNHTIQITGQIKRFAFNGGGDMLKILELSQWGDFKIDSTSIGVFKGCSNLRLTASDQPSFEGAATLESMFQGCTSLTGPALSWNISGVKSLRAMFQNCQNFNSPLIFTNTDSVMDMSYLLRGAQKFNQSLDSFNTSSVTLMTSMLAGTNNFNQPLHLDTRSVTDMQLMLSISAYNSPVNFYTPKLISASGMFYSNTVFNQSLVWDVPSLTDTSIMFQYAIGFNSPIIFTSCQNLQTLSNMFDGASQFNSTIKLIDATRISSTAAMFKDAVNFNQALDFSTSQVNNFGGMFFGASKFNMPLAFDTTNVNIFSAMFQNAISFNQSLNFNTASATDMGSMFQGASSFQQDLGAWNVSSVQWNKCATFCDSCGLPPFNMTMCNPCLTYNYYNSSRGWRMCNCPKTEFLSANQFQCVAVLCNLTGYTGSDGACTCATGYGPQVQFNNGVLSGCDPIPCNGVAYTGTGPENCMCASGYKGRVRYPNNTLYGCSPIGQFRSAWITSSVNEGVTLPFVVHKPNCTYNLVTVDWGDGNNDANYTTCDPISYSYLEPKEYVITIDGVVQGLSFHNRCDQLHRIDSWGAFQVDFQSAHTFDGCSNLILNTTDQPVILPGADMSYFFANTKFTQTLPFSWDMFNVVNMQGMFSGIAALGVSLFNPYTVNVNDTSQLFYNTNFNAVLQFDTSQVTNMAYMFANSNVSQSLDFLVTNNVVSMAHMFSATGLFDQRLDHFVTSSVTNMESMFENSQYNQPLFFDTVNVQSMNSMFAGATQFNSVLNFTSTAAVTSMSYMFAQATAYNQPLTFALSSQNLSHMFDGADAFVQNVSYRGANFSAPCDSFCKFCGILPHPGIANALGYCHPCPNDQYYFNAANVTVCNCPPGQSLLGANSNVCGPPTRAPSLAPVSPTNRVYAPTESPSSRTPTVSPSSRTPTVSPSSRTPTATIVVYSSGSNQTRVNASGVQVIIDQDPIFGLNGTVAIAIKPPNATVSPIVTINFFDGNNNEKNITGLSHPIVFVIPLVAGTMTSIQACLGQSPGFVMPLCNWFDTVDNTWKTPGCTTRILLGTQVECSCTHLTDFAALLPKVNHVPSSQLLALTPTNINAHPDGVITIAVVLLLFLVVVAISLLRDFAEKKREEVLRATKYDKWAKAVESQANIGLKQKWWKAYKSGLQLRHTWGSLFFRKTGTTFRSVDRAVVMLFMVLVLMAMSASFHDRNTTVVARAEVMVFNILALLAPSFVLTHLFTHTGELGFYEKYQIQRGMIAPSTNRILRYRFSERWRYVWYALVLACVIGMIVYILSIALMFDQNPTYYCQGQTTAAWLVDFIVPYIINVFVVEPLKIFILIATKNVMTDFVDTRARLEGESASGTADTTENSCVSMESRSIPGEGMHTDSLETP